MDQMTRTRTSRRHAAAILALSGLAMVLLHWGRLPLSDLLPLWLAGQALSEGDLGALYPPIDGVFTMRPPEGWATRAAEAGYAGPVFPFLYPPLWGLPFAAIPDFESFRTLGHAALVANVAMTMGTIWLALRLAGARAQPVLFAAFGVLAVNLTQIGRIPLIQGQAQVAVGFLLLLALERARARAPVAAGVALALAAALKIYPAVFALLWLATGQRRAFAAFVVAGSALAGLSVALCGWPAHALFLHSLREVAATVLVTGLSFNLPALGAQLLAAPALTEVPAALVALPPDPQARWAVLALPGWGAWGLRLALLAVLTDLAQRIRRADCAEDETLLWACALTAVPLLLPMSWGYYFLPTLVLLPALAPRLGGGAASLGIAGLLAALAIPLAPLRELAEPQVHDIHQALGTLAMAGAALAFHGVARARAPGDAVTAGWRSLRPTT